MRIDSGKSIKYDYFAMKRYPTSLENHSQAMVCVKIKFKVEKQKWIHLNKFMKVFRLTPRGCISDSLDDDLE